MISNFIPKMPKIPSLTTLTKTAVGEFNKRGIDIDTYRAKFMGNNARAYLFLCDIMFPSGITVQEKSNGSMGSFIQTAIRSGIESAVSTTFTSVMAPGKNDLRYFVKSTSLPESLLDETVTHYKGQQYKFSSVRRTNDWIVTFYVNHDASVISNFWNWQKMLQDPETNMYGTSDKYMADQYIKLIGLDGTEICTYILYKAWPKMIGNITLDYASNDFATMDVTFSYQYHDISTKKPDGLGTVSKDLLGNVASKLLTK